MFFQQEIAQDLDSPLNRAIKKNTQTASRQGGSGFGWIGHNRHDRFAHSDAVGHLGESSPPIGTSARDQNACKCASQQLVNLSLRFLIQKLDVLVEFELVQQWNQTGSVQLQRSHDQQFDCCPLDFGKRQRPGESLQESSVIVRQVFSSKHQVGASLLYVVKFGLHESNVRSGRNKDGIDASLPEHVVVKAGKA